MAYVSNNYLTNLKAPLGKWICSPGVSLEPFSDVPANDKIKHPNYCGQCVSFVRTVCPLLPPTGQWKQGIQVRSNQVIAGTAIATFNADGNYEGHAAIFDSQGQPGIFVYDQWVTPPNPQAVARRLLRWGAHGLANNGDNFYVVD